MFPESIQSYIQATSPEQEKILKQTYDLMLPLLPDSQVKLSYGMPTFWQKRNIIHFATQKKHLGIYPGPTVIALLADKFDQLGIQYSKGAILFPYNKDIPWSLIEEITSLAYKLHKGN